MDDPAEQVKSISSEMRRHDEVKLSLELKRQFNQFLKTQDCTLDQLISCKCVQCEWISELQANFKEYCDKQALIASQSYNPGKPWAKLIGTNWDEIASEANQANARLFKDQAIRIKAKEKVTDILFNEKNVDQKINSGKLSAQKFLKALKQDARYTRINFMQNCEQVIICDSEVADEDKVESTLWKNAFYIPIERLFTTKLIMTTSFDDQTQAQTLLQEILDEGIDFYEGMISKLQKMRSIEFEEYLTPQGQLGLNDMNEKGQTMLTSASKLHTALGDLHMYRGTFGHREFDFEMARSNWKKAQQLLPNKTGAAFSKLDKKINGLN